MNDPPIVFAGHGIQVALAQESKVVGLDQLVDAIGIAPHLRVETLNRAGILLSPMNGFDLFISANGSCNFWRRDGQRQRDQQNHEEDAEQEKSLFPCGTQARRFGFGNHWRSGNVCVLW
jgi:hypothetical protein